MGGSRDWMEILKKSSGLGGLMGLRDGWVIRITYRL